MSMWDTVISDGSGLVAIATAAIAIVRGRLKRERDRADKWQTVAGRQDETIIDLKEQIRDLRTVALIDERLDARLRPEQP